MSKKLIIKIRKDGTLEAETKGIKGKKCEDYIKVIEELTDSKVIKSEHTQEYYEDEAEVYISQTDKLINN